MRQARKAALFALIAFSVALGYVLLNYPVAEWLVSYAGWARANPLQSVPLFIAVFTLVTVLMAPAWPLTVFGGYLYGWLAGTAVVSIASLAGAVAGFLAARLLVRDWVARKVAASPRFQALDRAIAARGFAVVFLTRVSAVFPYNVLNYAYGVTALDLGRYALATWTGMLPVIALYVLGGATADDILALVRGETTAGPERVVIGIVAVIAVVLVFVLITRTATRLLEQDLKESSPPEEPADGS